MEQKILEEFKKKMKMQDRDDLRIHLDTDDWGNYEGECEIYEAADFGKVWNVITTKTGRIKDIWELG